MPEKDNSWNIERGQLLSLYSKYKNDDDKWAKILTELTLWVEKENKLDKIPLCSLADMIAEKVSHSNLVKPPDYRSFSTGKCSEESAVLMISDAHIGKVNEFFNPETNSSELTYNTLLFRKEAELLEKRVADVVKMLSTSIDIKKLYITFLGDIIDNDRIFDGQAAQIDMCVGEQLWEGVTTFTRFITNLLAVFPEIEVHSVIGNHGRSTGKRGDEPVPNSYEYTLAKILAKSFEHEPRVKFNIPNSWCGLAKIYDWKYFLHHGDSVYSWGSLPYYGLSRMGKSRRIEVPHNIDLCGHFHQRMEIPISQQTFTLVNGCWVMGDSYSWRKYGVISKPEQCFFGVNHKRPRTWSFNLELS